MTGLKTIVRNVMRKDGNDKRQFYNRWMATDTFQSQDTRVFEGSPVFLWADLRNRDFAMSQPSFCRWDMAVPAGLIRPSNAPFLLGIQVPQLRTLSWQL